MFVNVFMAKQPVRRSICVFIVKFAFLQVSKRVKLNAQFGKVNILYLAKQLTYNFSDKTAKWVFLF